ncbi:MAG: hypothetical protein CTY15_12820 [Methylocystis sp.]|nr:MAG: hypothetical protein CTY15_12820 [Methylocystis sp.]
MMPNSPLTRFFLIAGVTLAAQAAVLLFFGQPVICTCGYVKLWEGEVLSSGTSQHLADWYSFTHVVHGLLFYVLTWLAFPRLPALQRLLIAIGVEAGWEIFENTPAVVQAYRKQALAQGYVGDSVLNSISDVFMMATGFLLAWRLPVRIVVALGLALEIGLAFAIRDNLTLNLLNFAFPIEAVHRWQAGE